MQLKGWINYCKDTGPPPHFDLLYKRVMSFLQFLKADGAEEEDCIQQNEAESQPAI